MATTAVADPDAFHRSTLHVPGGCDPTPSSLDGVPARVEARLRAYGCGLIVRACAALQSGNDRGGGGEEDPAAVAVPAATAATAQALLHRYYCRHSLARPSTGDVRRVAAAMTWLALKLEEVYGDAHRATRRLLLVFARLEARDDAASASTSDPSSSRASPPPPLLVHSRPYEQRRASLVRIERLALDALGFSCAFEHPHKLLLGLSHVLSSPSSPSSPSPLAEEAWALANDSLRTPLCVRFGPEVLAAGCLFLASRRLRVALPEGDEDGDGKEGDEKEGGVDSGTAGGGGGGGGGLGEKKYPSSGPWWRLLGVSTEDVFEVARVVAALLEAEPPVYEDAGVWLCEREKRRREEEGKATTATTAGAASAAAAGLPPPSGLGSAAASAVAKARAAAARAAAARKKQRR